jgi:hypothetical protein
LHIIVEDTNQYCACPTNVPSATSAWSAILTPCHQATQKCVIAIPCIVDGSHISMLSYMTSCASVCQLVWLTFCFRVIDRLMQDAWVSSYKWTDQSWPPIFRTIRLQQMDHSFRYSLFFFFSCNHGFA